MSFAYNKYGCIISIDFGTTFSGSCYAITGGKSDKELAKGGNALVVNNDLKKSAGQRELRQIDINEIVFNQTDAKTPTIVIYDQYRQLSHWGVVARSKIANNEIGPSDKIFEKFKLALPKSVSQKGSVQRPGITDKSSEDDNLRATIDFFKVIYDHIYEGLQKQRVSSNYKFDNSAIRFVITVPAIWTNIERSVMRRVAIQAGLISEDDHENRLLIINESFAATLFAENELSDRILDLNDLYIICDAGGGTVDIASFAKIEAQPENMSYDRCQLTADSGDKCGSTFLDRNMAKLLSRVMFNEDLFEDEDYRKDDGKTSEKDDEEIKKKMDKRVKVERYVNAFISDNSEVHNPKPKFGDGLKPDIRDEVYFREHNIDNEENFVKLVSNATLFKEFDLYGRIYEEDDEDVDLTDSRNFEFYYEDIGESKTYYKNKDGILWSDEYELLIPLEVMVKKVFGPIVNTTLNLLDRQVKKVGGDVKAIFLVGGLGRNEYLRRRIEQEFKNRVEYVLKATTGDTAAMRGAAYYGVGAVKRPSQTDINIVKYDDNGFDASQYDTLICIDVGYDHTSCSYVNLDNGSENAIEVKNWPGAPEDSVQIPTAFDKVNNLWGAQVTETTNLDAEKLIVPSKLMSIVKGDLKRFLVNFLSRVHQHILGQIEKNESKTDQSKFRYCITLENSYRYFNHKKDMRRIAIDAGIIKEDDDSKRLLLIRREDAVAMHFENTFFKKKTFSTYFLQIFFRHDSCHLSLEEAIKLSGFAEYQEKLEEEDYTKNFRNVRGIRSSTLEFNFVSKLVANFDMFITKNPCIRCDNPNTHPDYYPTYYPELRKGLLKFIKEELDFSKNEHMQEIRIRSKGCCTVKISVYDLLEHVLRPAIRDLVSEINRHFTQTDMTNFRLNQIFLVDKLFEAKDNTYDFLERIFIKTLAEVMNTESKIIQSAEKINQAAVNGAVLYGTEPERYTERVARKTYFVTIEASKVQKFEDSVIKATKKEKDPNKIYDIEAKNAYKGTVPIPVFFQPAHTPSKFYPIDKNYTNVLVERGQKVTESDQTNGIKRRFFVREDCLVHASIYTTETDHTEFFGPEKGTDNNPMPDPKIFQKIHQFEIYVKEDPNDPMNKLGSPRHYFEIKMIPDNNEVKFEAQIGTRIGEKIPEFRFRDEILASHIYSDANKVKLEKTSRIKPKTVKHEELNNQ